MCSFITTHLFIYLSKKKLKCYIKINIFNEIHFFHSELTKQKLLYIKYVNILDKKWFKVLGFFKKE